MEKKRVLMFYLKSGGGHLSIALALKSALEAMYPDQYEFEICLGIPDNQRFWQKFTEQGYEFTSSYVSFAYGILYYISCIPLLMKGELAVFTKITYDHVKRKIDEFKPHMIINTHPFIIQPVNKIIKNMDPKPYHIVTILDLISPPHWFTSKETNAIVSTKYLYNLAITKYKYNPAKLKVFPPIMNPLFKTPLSRDEIKKMKIRYGYNPDKNLILLTGGGTGLPGCELIVRFLLQHHVIDDIVILCGNNKLMQKSVQTVVKPFQKENQIIEVKGFVDYMHDLMQMADVIISKAGFSSIFQALILKKPLIISSYIQGQEQGNARYIANTKMGIVETNPLKVAAAVERILENKSIRDELFKNIENNGINNGVFAVAEYMDSIIASMQG